MADHGMYCSVMCEDFDEDDIEMSVCGTPVWGQPAPLAVRVGFVKCEYCATSQRRPDDGRCCACGGPTPHIDEAIYAR